MVTKARVVNYPFQLNITETGITLEPLPDDSLGPPGLLYFTNTGILGMMGLKTVSFTKARTLCSHIFSWLLMVLRWALALQSSTGAFLIDFCIFFLRPITCLWTACSYCTRFKIKGEKNGCCCVLSLLRGSSAWYCYLVVKQCWVSDTVWDKFSLGLSKGISCHDFLREMSKIERSMVPS